MKKIYMILAALTLLSMSLNAQSYIYQKVTSTTDLTDGEYLIVCEAQSKAYNGALAESALKGTYNTINVTINNNTIASTTAVDAATFTYNSSDGSLKSASGYYIYRETGTSGGSVATSTTVPTTVNTITFSDGNASIKCVGASNYYLKYNSNNDCFRYYVSGQTVVQLYKKVTSTTTSLTVPASVNVGVNTGSGASNTFNLSGSNLNQSLSLSVDDADFDVMPKTISAADAMAGTTVTVYYDGTSPSASAMLTISSSEVSATVNLTASYSAPNIYEKVTSDAQLAAGKKYILVYETTPAVMGLGTISSNYGESVTGATLDVNNDEIDVSGATGVSELTLGGSTGAWTFTADGTNFIAYTNTSDKNQLNTSTDATANTSKWTATSSNGGYILTNVGATNRILQYNNSSGQLRFACYKGTQQDAFLYVQKSTTAELTSIANGDIINVGTHSGNGVSKNVNIKGNNLTQDLTVNVSGTGFSISRAVTVTAAEANSANGQDVIVTYNGTDANATGTLTVTSNEIGTVTAQLTASYNNGSTPSGETGTVGNGATSSYVLPAYGSYQDYGYKNQMIYTAAKLAEAGIQRGDQITSITFYPTTASGYNGGIDFYGSTVTLSLGNTEVSSFSGSKITPSDLTDVVTITPVRDNNATEWTFSWSTPFTYTGENLLVQVYCPGYEHDGTNGEYGRTYFKGDNQNSNVGLYSYNSSAYSTSATSGTSGTNSTFQPQATFTYVTSANPVLTAPENGDNVALGTYEAPATEASTTIYVKGRNLTQPLSVSVSGTGFSVSTNSVSAADANAGTYITVTYDGTDPTATGTLTITSGDTGVSPVTVNLTSGYISHNPVLTAPTSGTTIDVGSNTGAGVSTTVTVSGEYLTQDLNVSVTGEGFLVAPSTLSAADVNGGTTITVTYTGYNSNAQGTLTISSGEVSVTVPLTASFSAGIEPTVHGMVRMGTIPIVDQFAEKIPDTNDHPYRYTYYLQLAYRDVKSSPARVPVQHTGAEIEGYYTKTQMQEDTDPTKFLTTNVLSAEVDMNLSPSSAPYFYTINSVLNGVPATADDYTTYLNVLQRREAGDYQEMQNKYNNEIVNPNLYKTYSSGENDFLDYRTVIAASANDYLSYAPIVWTKGIDRYYYTSDSLHNSYGAPLWEVHSGNVTMIKPQYERQAKNANGDWNPYVNWKDENNQDCSLFAIKSLHATGILPTGNIEYEPYMFRLWVYCDGLRNCTQNPQNGEAVNDPTADRTSPRLLDTKYCHGADDLSYDIVKDENNWDNNIYFGALNSISNPTFVVRFYYVVKGYQESNRGEGDDHVGYVAEGEGTPDDPWTVVYELSPDAEVVNQIYYNPQGMQSDRPFDGINIVVTRYSDGTTRTTKMIMK